MILYKHGELVVLLRDFDREYKKNMLAVVDDYGFDMGDEQFFSLKPSLNDNDHFLFPATFFRHATKNEKFLYQFFGWDVMIK